MEKKYQLKNISTNEKCRCINVLTGGAHSTCRFVPRLASDALISRRTVDYARRHFPGLTPARPGRFQS